MEIVVVGLSHKTAPVEVREKFSFAGDKLDRALQELIKIDTISEGVILSTCNRVEIYANARNADEGRKSILDLFSGFHGVELKNFESNFYQYNFKNAINHILCVASSLDSMVVGEPQILGQLKQAYSKALEYKTTGATLNHLFHKSFNVAKRVRSETGIAKNAVSISFAAVELARKIFGSLDSRSAMIIGAGEMSELVARHLLSNGIKNIYVVNRTVAKAEELAKEFEGIVVPYESMEENLYLADIVITSTGAPHFILGKKEVEYTIAKRKNDPLFMIDIAVPRDLDPEINKVNDVYLYDIDDLDSVIQANLAERKKEALMAQEIIDKEVRNVLSWLSGRDVVPVIVNLRNKMEVIRKKELQRVMPKLNGISEKDKCLVEALSVAIINKILHRPTTTLRRTSDSEDIHSYTEVTRALFGLDND